LRVCALLLTYVDCGRRGTGHTSMAKLCYMTGKHRCVKYAVSSRGASVNLIDILIKYANAAFVGDAKEATEIADASTSLYPSNRDITFNMISPIPVRSNGTGEGVSLKPVALTRLYAARHDLCISKVQEQFPDTEEGSIKVSQSWRCMHEAPSCTWRV